MEEKEFSLSGSPAVYSETESPPAIRLAVVDDGGGSVPQEMNTTFNTSTGIVAAAPAGGVGGGSGGVLGKKKRGRPRKYDSDGNLRVPHKSPPPPPPGFFLSPPPPSDFSAKRGRGRPAGSGNWQLLASLGEIIISQALDLRVQHIVIIYSRANCLF